MQLIMWALCNLHAPMGIPNDFEQVLVPECQLVLLKASTTTSHVTHFDNVCNSYGVRWQWNLRSMPCHQNKRYPPKVKWKWAGYDKPLRTLWSIRNVLQSFKRWLRGLFVLSAKQPRRQTTMVSLKNFDGLCSLTSNHQGWVPRYLF